MQWLAFLVAVVFGWIVSFVWRFLTNLSAFWTPNARGIGRFAFGITGSFRAFICRLPFFPIGFAPFARLTPFPAMVNTPLEIFLGQLSGPPKLRSPYLTRYFGHWRFLHLASLFSAVVCIGWSFKEVKMAAERCLKSHPKNQFAELSTTLDSMATDWGPNTLTTAISGFILG